MKNYFPHDFNARHDTALSVLISEFGAAGYGIFWVVVEMLHEAEENRIPLKAITIKAIALSMRLDEVTTNAILDRCLEYDLLAVRDGFLYSERVLRNAEKRNEMIAQRSAAGKASAQIRKKKAHSTTVQQPFNDRSTKSDDRSTKSNEPQQKKRKEKKEKEYCSSTDASLHEFEFFWNLYDKKKDQQRARKKWDTLTQDQRKAAIEALPAYVDCTPDKTYRKNPATWLIGECWNDEITPPKSTETLPPKTLNERYARS